MRLIFLVVSLVLFALAAFGVGHPRVNLVALGLGTFVASFLLP